MAELNTIKAGDVVRGENWPAGMTATVLSVKPFQVINRDARGRTKLVDSTKHVVCYLDRTVYDVGEEGYADAAWMELGLVKIDA